jgi:hypothetical protein
MARLGEHLLARLRLAVVVAGTALALGATAGRWLALGEGAVARALEGAQPASWAHLWLLEGACVAASLLLRRMGGPWGRGLALVPLAWQAGCVGFASGWLCQGGWAGVALAVVGVWLPGAGALTLTAGAALVQGGRGHGSVGGTAAWLAAALVWALGEWLLFVPLAHGLVGGAPFAG